MLSLPRVATYAQEAMFVPSWGGLRLLHESVSLESDCYLHSPYPAFSADLGVVFCLTIPLQVCIETSGTLGIAASCGAY